MYRLERAVVSVSAETRPSACIFSSLVSGRVFIPRSNTAAMSHNRGTQTDRQADGCLGLRDTFIHSIQPRECYRSYHLALLKKANKRISPPKFWTFTLMNPAAGRWHRCHSVCVPLQAEQEVQLVVRVGTDQKLSFSTWRRWKEMQAALKKTKRATSSSIWSVWTECLILSSRAHRPLCLSMSKKSL